MGKLDGIRVYDEFGVMYELVGVNKTKEIRTVYINMFYDKDRDFIYTGFTHTNKDEAEGAGSVANDYIKTIEVKLEVSR
jgi:hypothetical protein